MTSSARTWGVLALSCAMIVGVAAPATAAPLNRSKPLDPHAVLIGGNLKENAEILQTIVDLADPDGTGPARARIAIVTAASSTARTPAEAADPTLNNAAANGLYYAELFGRFGADTYAVPIDTRADYDGDAYSPARASDPEVAAQIAASTGVFFGGGDQMRYVRTLFTCDDAELEAFTSCTDTPAMTAIRQVAGRGVVAGVSAGLTIQQGADMITGGESYQALRDGATPGYLDDATALGYLPFGGFGFVDGVLLDSHFTTWGRQGRAAKLALETGNPYVLGVDETTAVVLDRDDHEGRVIGEHGASILDVTRATVTDTGIENVRWSYASAGDEIDLRGRAEVEDARGAKKLKPRGADAAVRTDVWDSIDGDGGVYSLRDLAREVAASRTGVGTGVSFEGEPRFETVLTRDRKTDVWTTPAGAVSFSDLRMDIRLAD